MKNYLRWRYRVKNSLGCEPSQIAHVDYLNSYATLVRFFGCFDSLRSPFGPAFGCYSRSSLRLVLPASPTFFKSLLADRRSRVLEPQPI